LEVALKTIEVLPDLFSAILVGVALWVTYKTTSQQNKVNFISSKHRERLESLSDDISTYLGNAKFYFTRINAIRGTGDFNDLFKEFNQSFYIDYTKIAIRIDDEYKDLRDLAKELYQTVIDSNDIDRLGRLISQMIISTREMLKTEEDKIKADIGIKIRKKRIRMA
jgi:hypothetical protein